MPCAYALGEFRTSQTARQSRHFRHSCLKDLWQNACLYLVTGVLRSLALGRESVGMSTSALRIDDQLFSTAIDSRTHSWRTMLFGYVVEVVGIAAAVIIAATAPTVVAPDIYSHVTLVAPSLERPREQPKPPARPRVMAPPITELARLTPPKLTAPVVKLNVSQPKVLADIPSPKLPPAPQPKFDSSVIGKPAGPSIARSIQTDTFGGSSAVPTLKNTPAHEVQTGGFGDPNGVAPNPNAKSQATIAAVGSFDLPSGPGQGNGSGGARGKRGTVASAGFGNGIATEGGGGGRGTAAQGRVQVTTFAVGAPIAEAPKRARPVEVIGPATAVEITAKPNPVYTDEARRMHLEGQVVLKVLFTASGQVQVLSVVQGLGHGLDEAAVKAAQAIRFAPAQRQGQPIDSTATLRIIFQLT